MSRLRIATAVDPSSPLMAATLGRSVRQPRGDAIHGGRLHAEGGASSSDSESER